MGWKWRTGITTRPIGSTPIDAHQLECRDGNGARPGTTTRVQRGPCSRLDPGCRRRPGRGILQS